jgi:hypothetical protein
MALSLDLVFDELNSDRIKVAAERLDLSPSQLLLQIVMEGLRRFEHVKEIKTQNDPIRKFEKTAGRYS